MPLALNDEQRQLQDQVRALLSERATPDQLRKTITDKQPWDEGLWRALAEMGVLGAGIPEEFGGVGLGALDIGVIAQELGRTVAPVPFFSSICLAAEAILIAGSQAQKEAWLPKLASGEVVATFAWTEANTPPSLGLIGAKLEGGKLTGVKTPVPDAEIAQVCVVAALKDGKPALALVDLSAAGVTRTPLKGIDELRWFSKLEFADAPAEAMDAIDGAEALQKVLDRAAAYEAFEQVGGAEGALTMARDYALQRYIFGRQLASYQAVKHSLANIYAKLELAACNALGAAKALSENAPDAAAAAATARVSATTVYETIARENLQLHGGIGFTWEADCHFHYRRARTLALNIGSVEFWSDRLVAALDAAPDEGAPKAAAAGSAPPARVAQPDSPEDAEYRAKARAWLEENGPKHPVPKAGYESKSFTERGQAWQRAKFEAGYAAIAQPKAFGGAGGTRRQQQIFLQEEARAKLSGPFGGAGYVQALAAITQHGSPEQRAHWETASYRGDIVWCQLFSEPGAGSDLGAVRTKAVKDGDKWIVNGQKVWTSGGHLANYGILLARTNPDVPKHQGLSFFIIDMTQPGVEVRPIRQINGQTGFTETFLTDAVVPDAWRLDAEGQGWAVAMSVLAQERNTTDGIGDGPRRTSSTSARTIVKLAREAKRDGGSAFDSASVRGRIADFHAQAQGIKNFTVRMGEEMARGGPPPANIPVIKLSATNRVQQIQAFLMDLQEAGGLVVDPDARGEDHIMAYVSAAANRIAGGADEVLRNQLAERALGMPGDVRADKDVPFSQLPF